MSLPESGTIRLSEIKTEFGKGNNLLDYLGEGGVTGSAPLKLTDFYGLSAGPPILGDLTTTGSGAGRGKSAHSFGGTLESEYLDMNSNWVFGVKRKAGTSAYVYQFLPTMLDCNPGSIFSGEEYTVFARWNEPTNIGIGRTEFFGRMGCCLYHSATNTPLTGFEEDNRFSTFSGGGREMYKFPGGSGGTNRSAYGSGTLPTSGYAQLGLYVFSQYQNSDQGYLGYAADFNTGLWEFKDPTRAIERLKKLAQMKMEDMKMRMEDKEQSE